MTRKKRRPEEDAKEEAVKQRRIPSGDNGRV